MFTKLLKTPQICFFLLFFRGGIFGEGRGTSCAVYRNLVPNQGSALAMKALKPNQWTTKEFPKFLKYDLKKLYTPKKKLFLRKPKEDHTKGHHSKI